MECSFLVVKKTNASRVKKKNKKRGKAFPKDITKLLYVTTSTEKLKFKACSCDSLVSRPVKKKFRPCSPDSKPCSFRQKTTAC